MHTYVDQFSNREIAVIIWTVLFVAFAMSKKGVRSSLHRLIRVLFDRRIIQILLAMSLYVLGMIVVYRRIGLWDPSLAKDTVYWVIGTALILLFRINDQVMDEKYFRNRVIENVRFIVLLEFIINLQSFNIIAEMLLVPSITFIVALGAVSETRAKHVFVQKLVNSLLLIIGIVLIACTVNFVAKNPLGLVTFDNIRALILPPLLTLSYLPFLYLFALFLSYDTVFNRIDYYLKANKRVARYAKRKTLRHNLFNLRKLNKFIAYLTRELTVLSNKDDVSDIFHQYGKMKELPTWTEFLDECQRFKLVRLCKSNNSFEQFLEECSSQMERDITGITNPSNRKERAKDTYTECLFAYLLYETKQIANILYETPVVQRGLTDRLPTVDFHVSFQSGESIEAEVTHFRSKEEEVEHERLYRDIECRLSSRLRKRGLLNCVSVELHPILTDSHVELQRAQFLLDNSDRIAESINNLLGQAEDCDGNKYLLPKFEDQLQIAVKHGSGGVTEQSVRFAFKPIVKSRRDPKQEIMKEIRNRLRKFSGTRPSVLFINVENYQVWESDFNEACREAFSDVSDDIAKLGAVAIRGIFKDSSDKNVVYENPCPRKLATQFPKWLLDHIRSASIP